MNHGQKPDPTQKRRHTIVVEVNFNRPITGKEARAYIGFALQSEKVFKTYKEKNAIQGRTLVKDGARVISTKMAHLKRKMELTKKPPIGIVPSEETLRKLMQKDTCEHEDYSFKKHGRRCPKCGITMTDWGD